ncbi:hypothetical protein EDF77_2071 [Stenotrophomonas maltophilia]|uniref:hypothetical protein n=1 Tax=Stenotrophomonas chelatiphaga TaxID=517011 RepID=UPI000F4CC1DF|nr:hypothetical protein [Stenotrophomonas chelatiphaga]MCS4232010.1 hypothetical protein [Stenotrophomonas chelatiphaga]ROQ42593.1 hypothetical protein EDF77_2071 [Stenotrophomonas maltophilia]
MNTSVQHRMTRMAASAVGLLLLSLWFGVAHGGADDTQAAPALNSLQDAGVPDAGNAPPAPSPPRRLNSSLSMPYFSFAQSLNSRS